MEFEAMTCSAGSGARSFEGPKQIDQTQRVLETAELVRMRLAEIVEHVLGSEMKNVTTGTIPTGMLGAVEIKPPVLVGLARSTEKAEQNFIQMQRLLDRLSAEL